MAHSRFVILLLLSLIPFCFSWGENEDHGLIAQISPSHHVMLGEEPSSKAIFQFNLHNPSSRPVTILKWGTPLEDGLFSNIFDVKNIATGEQIPYIGVYAFRKIFNMESSLDQFETIQPSETLIRHVDISPYYDFSSDQTKGTYSISLNTYATFFVGTFDDAKEVGLFNAPYNKYESYFSIAPLTTDSIKMVITSSDNDTKSTLTIDDYSSVGPKKLGMYYTYCQANQVQQLTKIEQDSLQQINNAINYLNVRRCDQEYVTWYGVYDQRRWNTVRDRFQRFKQRVEQKSYNYVCGDKPNDQFKTCQRGSAAAYMYQSFSYNPNIEMNLCPSFWNLDANVRASVIYHELSHHECCGTTMDHCYFDSCRQLARTDPEKALGSAGCYDQFGIHFPRC